VLIFPSIFLDALTGTSYWNLSGHSLGIVLLVLAVATLLAWAAAWAGTPTRGLDLALSLVLFGLLAVVPVGAAFGDFGSLDTGAWLGLAGGILAAGGTWAARGAEMPHAAAAPAA
jgi:ABC-type glycerol-3-phosphate transport system permease component